MCLSRVETAGPGAEPLGRPWISRIVAKVARICPLNEIFPGAERPEFALLMRPSLVLKALRQEGAALTSGQNITFCHMDGTTALLKALSPGGMAGLGNPILGFFSCCLQPRSWCLMVPILWLFGVHSACAEFPPVP